MRFCEKLRHMMLESNMEFGFETVGSRPDQVDFIRDAKNRGYSIVLVFVTTGDPEICISRIAQRVAAGGHGVPDDKVRSRYVRTMSMLPQYLDLADEAILCDNGGGFPQSRRCQEERCCQHVRQCSGMDPRFAAVNPDLDMACDGYVSFSGWETGPRRGPVPGLSRPTRRRAWLCPSWRWTSRGPRRSAPRP